jgi:hypothetical protein
MKTSNFYHRVNGDCTKETEEKSVEKNLTTDGAKFTELGIEIDFDY